MPRRRPRTRSSRRTRRWGASGRGRRSGPGCWRSCRTRHGTGSSPRVAVSGSRCAWPRSAARVARSRLPRRRSSAPSSATSCSPPWPSSATPTARRSPAATSSSCRRRRRRPPWAARVARSSPAHRGRWSAYAPGWSLPMRDLEQTLLQIGRELEWPETPDLAASVTATLRATAAGVAEHPPPGAERRLREPEADKVDGRRAGERRRGVRARGPRLVLRGLLPSHGLRRALVLALVSLLVLSGAVFAAVPSVRDAVLEFIGLQGATVERREDLPPPPPIEPLDLGALTTLEAAGERLAFEPLVPGDPGEPD